MKYLLNTLFVSLFIVTVGCSNELIGLDEEINPISATEMQLNTNASSTAFVSTDGRTDAGQADASNKLKKEEAVLTDHDITMSGDDQDNPEPPGGNN